MRIDHKARVAGYPAIVIRDLLRGLGEGRWDADSVAERLGIARRAAEFFIERLQTAGYVQLDTDAPRVGRWFTRTSKGNRLALASAAQPLTRVTAERQLQAFLQRVKAVNDNPYYLYRVTKVVLFGSMLTRKRLVSDVDVAIELQPRCTDPQAHRAASDARSRDARRGGRRFSNLVDEIHWPRREVLLFLKSRSRAISIREADGLVLSRTRSSILYAEDRAR